MSPTAPEDPTQGNNSVRSTATHAKENGDDDPSINGHAVRSAAGSDTTAKLEALSKEREALRQEVEQMRKQLESIQEGHTSEVTQLRTELEESNAAKEGAEEAYQNLLGRVNQIKETLSERLRRDKEELEEAKERIEELEAQNDELRGASETTGSSAAKVRAELEDAQRELSTLRSRNNLSATNWQKERDELLSTVQHLKDELSRTSGVMGEWEVIAMEERSVKQSLLDKVGDLEDQVASLRSGYEAACQERDAQDTLVDNLQNALREIQDARKRELREMVESTDQQLEAYKKIVHEAEARAADAIGARDSLTAELERTAPFEKEVKEKNLLIGKLRHEAIVLNDHLTKALRYLKKTKPEDNVDRQIVTNHLLHFLTLDRGDVKRFQVLQVMAGYLNWTDEQREQAGLSRPGASSSNSLRLPLSPFNRTPSSPPLSADLFSEPSSGKDRESLAELWAGFLERSAQEGAGEASGNPPIHGLILVVIIQWPQHIPRIHISVTGDVVDVDPVCQGIVDAADDVGILHDVGHQVDLVSPVGVGAGAQVLVPHGRIPDDAQGVHLGPDGQQAAVYGVDAVQRLGLGGEGAAGDGGVQPGQREQAIHTGGPEEHVHVGQAGGPRVDAVVVRSDEVDVQAGEKQGGHGSGGAPPAAAAALARGPARAGGGGEDRQVRHVRPRQVRERVVHVRLGLIDGAERAVGQDVRAEAEVQQATLEVDELGTQSVVPGRERVAVG
ncbi:LOW QUALITY PROTEIN: Chromosome segregation ATPase [Geosmithia morbida]|uniref:Chromosome segregation ATPase n=1 Tax=Geosmithia morbida TaxID=1094350 RepID=A0A9P4YPV2_9HYPO|nr:LOW QUALITY PROTEIN: Chromosome segregation ATPase [Geosmithia morbida]KAF4119426.1 LOW QUALITY PROTEIN: Chromosome segregation ATPase [Geosmithia morbida]